MPNRIIMAPMGTGYADESHCVTDRLVDYHVARAKGGVGLNIVEHTAVHPTGLTDERMLGIYDDSHLPGLTALVHAVHDAGGRIAIQLQHGGRQAKPELTGGEVFAPSAVPAGRDGRMPRVLTVRQIRHLVRAFAQAAFRAKKAGADGVEIHLAHGYLGASFLSPLLNLRIDRYGGTVVRRVRFAREIITLIKRKCGVDFPVWCRVSGDEFVPGGMTVTEFQQVVPLLVECGYCAIHVSGCMGETAHRASAPYLAGAGYLLDLAAAAARVTDAPVIGVGGLLTPDEAEHAIADGRCDAIALGRALLADATWAQKALADRHDEIISCLQCNQGCLDRRYSINHQCECTVNPATGHEREWQAKLTLENCNKSRKVLVVGGGPAGMTAALTAAQRGHQVTLWETHSCLGGSLELYYPADRSGAFRRYIDHQTDALDRAGVEICWQQEADLYKVAAFQPDVLINATGSVPVKVGEILRLSGPLNVINVIDYLRNPERKLTGAVVVLGAGECGCYASLELTRRGHEVLLVEAAQQVCADMPQSVRLWLEQRLCEAGVRLLANCRATAIDIESRVTINTAQDVEKQLPPADIIIALGRRSNEIFAGAQHRLKIPVNSVGDAAKLRSLHETIHDAAKIACEI